MPTQLELAYIAGLFDGEGCVQLKKRMETKGRLKSGKLKRSNSTIITLELSMTDQPVVRWFHKILNVGAVNINIKNKSPSSKPHYKDQLRWRCGYRDALKVAKLIISYTHVKRKKLQQIIDHYDKFPLRYTNDRDVRVHHPVSRDGHYILDEQEGKRIR